MTIDSRNPVQQQVRRARRRLFLKRLLDDLLWCWAAALALAAGWFLVQPHLTGQVDESWRWAGAAALVGFATIVAAGLAWWRAPRPVEVALALDERLGLKERLTTALGLSANEARSPAGLALLADVNQRIASPAFVVHFRLRPTWSAALVPVAAAVLTLVALFYQPAPWSGRIDRASATEKAQAQAREMEQTLKHIRQRSVKTLPKDEREAKELQELDDAWKRLLEKKLDTKDREMVREQVQALRSLEERLKDRSQGLRAQVEKNQAFLRQLQKLQTLDPGKRKLDKAGSVSQVEQALSQGKLAKAEEALEALQKKLAGPKLDRAALQQLREQLQGLRNKLQRLAEQKEKKDELERARQQGELDEDQLKQALEQLEQEGQDLEELAKLLDECQDGLQKGGAAQAAGKLQRIAGKLKEMQLTEEELRDLEENAEVVQACREGMCQRLNGMGGKGLPGGRRPVSPDGRTQAHDARQKATLDAKGSLRITGFSRGGTFSKIPARDVQRAFRKAVQEAPEGIEHQRIAPEAAEMLKGYFTRLGGQGKN